MPPTISQAELLRRTMEANQLEIHTAIPGKVKSYNASTQTAEVELLIRRVTPARDDDDPDEIEDYPILPSVPVLQLRGAGYFVYIPLAAGDPVLVVFCENDINEWRRTGDVSDPGVGTRHGLSGAVCIPGLHHQHSELSQSNRQGPDAKLVVGLQGGPAIAITQTEIQAGGTAALAKWAGIESHLTAIQTALNNLQVTIGGAAVASTTPYVKATVEATANTPTTTLKGS